MKSSPRDAWTLVAAVARNEIIGKQGDLPWHLSSDLKRFKRLTMGHCLLMGRKTYESIGRPLPGRQTIVLSSSGFDASADSVSVVSELDQVDALVQAERQVMVVGGAQVYQATIARCSTLWLTRVLEDVEGDTRFPKVDWQNWELVGRERCEAGPQDDWPSEFQTWRRVGAWR